MIMNVDFCHEYTNKKGMISIQIIYYMFIRGSFGLTALFI